MLPNTRRSRTGHRGSSSHDHLPGDRSGRVPGGGRWVLPLGDDRRQDPRGFSAVIRAEQDTSGSFFKGALLRLPVGFDSACTSGSCSTVELVMGVDLPCSTAYTVNASLVED